MTCSHGHTPIIENPNFAIFDCRGCFDEMQYARTVAPPQVPAGE